MSPEPAGVAFRDVTRTYRSPGGSVEALHAVSASVEAGTIGALVGPSGSGKSTLLRILGGVDPADGGAVAVHGVDVRALAGAALRRYRRTTAAYVAQRAASNLVPHLTVRDQLGEGGVELAGRLGLARRLEAVASALSGGEQARAAVAVGLSRRTPVVLLDEPTAELDDAAAALVVDELAHAAAGGRTIVVATHDAALVAVADARIELTQHATPARPLPRARAVGAARVVVLDGLTKAYDGTTVVDHATLDVREGELAVLLGRSGSGKSTLLMTAGGWLTADAGTMTVPGVHWNETAYVAQRFGLIPELSIAENVGLPLRLRGRPNDGRVEELLDRLALAPLAARLPAETSIGQQQRTAIARALVDRPAALLADEPSSHQDARSAELVWQALDAACAAGVACLVATHDEAAAAHADRVFRIDDGRIL